MLFAFNLESSGVFVPRRFGLLFPTGITFNFVTPVKVVSSLKADRFAWELRHHPDSDKVTYMVQGLRFAFLLPDTSACQTQ